jgi:polyphosphate kinase
VRYAHIGTGNFNEKTAKIYTDFSLFTRHPEITAEVDNVFEFIEHPYRRIKFNHLLVSPINSRRYIYRLIDNELTNAPNLLVVFMSVRDRSQRLAILKHRSVNASEEELAEYLRL